MQCPLCGTANPAQARFCLGCGQLLVGGLVCTVCHTLLPGHARYCFHCGAIVVPPAAVCSRCGAGVAPDQVQCGQCGAPVAQLPTPAMVAPPAEADAEALRAAGEPTTPG